MIEVILQHRQTGLYLGNNEIWGERSRNALLFCSVTEATRFAEAAALGDTVRPVFRFQRDTHYILIPVLDDPVEALLPTAAPATARRPR